MLNAWVGQVQLLEQHTSEHRCWACGLLQQHPGTTKVSPCCLRLMPHQLGYWLQVQRRPLSPSEPCLELPRLMEFVGAA